ncbi:hypothetical protein Poli38472_006533 [Pythium oligandrum]|uniref:Vps16 C-terminal domain-containing protein n=1 Tax=Pythium oligandrum TaxID=41045 RepID=A0A8K1FD54_PYTOL|nr:hypothetical protein Poli38472_006529 [Pythium oligandrum]TMW56523.1 hypothetical protein Poli38472_006533 [Pythium oligandrum]|eukprot:TMW56519.1 hypothetical protein Poli38472_006529 [Pythium oligandrum]
MGGVWSQWRADDGSAFHKKRFLDTEGSQAFYASLLVAVAAIERETEANYPQDDEQCEQVQQILENWPREAAVLYNRVSDFPLILPLPDELQAKTETVETSTPLSPASPRQSKQEVTLQRICANPLSTSDAIYQAVQAVMKTKPFVEDAVGMIAKYPRAARLLFSQLFHARCDAKSALHVLQQRRQWLQAAALVGKTAYGEESFVKKRRRLQEMNRLLARTGQDQSSPNTFEQVVTQETLELLDAQNKLENRFGVVHLVGSSLIDTIHKLLSMYPTHSQALRASVSIAEQFAVHPRQYWWCLLKILPHSDQWQVLFTLAAMAPPPYGFVPIARVLIEEDRLELASELLALISSSDEEDTVNQLVVAASAAKEDGS